MKKRFLAVCLVISIIFIFGGCNKSSESDDKKDDSPVITEENNKDKENEETNLPKEEAEQNNNSNTSKVKKEKCRLFFFDAEKLETFYVDKEIEITDNAKVGALTKAVQDFKGNDKFICLTNKVGVSSAKLDGDVLRVYFNDDFTKQMTLGTATESGLIESLIDTYGYNYNVKKVAIYMKGELYSGLGDGLSEGYFTVNTEGVKAYTEK